MNDADRKVQQRLERLTAATADLEPRSDFNERIWLAVGARAAGDSTQAWSSGAVPEAARAGRRALPAMFLAALCVVAFSLQIEPRVDDAFIAGYGEITDVELSAGLDPQPALDMEYDR